jgi:hypothetical protein
VTKRIQSSGRPISAGSSRGGLSALLAVAVLASAAAVVTGCGDDPDPTTDAANPDTDAGIDGSETDLPDADTDADAGETTSDGSEIDVADAEEDVEPSANLQCDGEAGGSIDPGDGLVLAIDVEGGATELETVWLGREVTEATGATLRCDNGSILPEGFVALSPVYEVDTGSPLPFARRFFVTAPFDRTLLPEGAGAPQIRLFWRPSEERTAIQPLVANFQENMVRGTVRFETERPGQYQFAVAEDAGETYEREWKFRAVTGISMGASGASMLALRNPELFDIVAPLGGPSGLDFPCALHPHRGHGRLQ